MESVFEKVRGPLCLRDGILKTPEDNDSSRKSNGAEKQRNVKTLRLNEEKILKDHDLIINHLEILSSESFPISGSRKRYDQILNTPTSLRAFREAVQFGTPRFASSSLPSLTSSYQTIKSAPAGGGDLTPDSTEEQNQLVDYRPSVSKKLRGEGWKFSPIDFSKDGRARRRRYGDLLTYTPILKKITFGPKVNKETSLPNLEDLSDPTSKPSTGSFVRSDSLSPFSPLSNSGISLKYNSSKSPFKSKYLAELIDEVNNPNSAPLKAQAPAQASTSSSTSAESASLKTSSKSTLRPKSSKMELVYSIHALHSFTSDFSKDHLEAKRAKLWVDDEDIKILN